MITIASLAALTEQDIIHLQRVFKRVEGLKYKTIAGKLLRKTELLVNESVAIQQALQDLHKFISKRRIRSTGDLMKLRDDKRIVMKTLIKRAGYKYTTVTSYMSREQTMSQETLMKMEHQLKLIAQIVGDVIAKE